MENLLSSEKILFEKRKRHQTYAAMGHFLSIGTYFDFFSPDTFLLIKTAYFIAQSTNKAVTLDLLFLSYFYENSKVATLSKELNIFSEFQRSLAESFPELLVVLEKAELKKNGISLSNIIRNTSATPFPEKAMGYSQEIWQVFEKASNNAVTRFKTPVITPEILFITLMEQTSTKISKVIKNSFDNEIEWHLFRYELMKLIHREESTLRNKVNLNERYFGYLFKTQVDISEVKAYMKTSTFNQCVSFFRNILLQKIMGTNIFDCLFEEIHASIQLTSKRNYSL
jgi:hypothetical protein